ncbi:sensor histidine kinase [Mycobacteroides chelonae]|uniref:sensor histidine kinase n=1 Tax=Mycobacteroides chelonae TaxID=1774 RepID=UPI0009921452|nr:histidine kinase [Mycobacteroides chelonae]
MRIKWDFVGKHAQPWLLRCLPIVVVPVLLLGSIFHRSTHENVLFVILAMAAAVIYPAIARWPRSVAFIEATLSIPIVGLTAWGPAEAIRQLGAVAAADAAARSDTAPRAFAVMTPWFLASAIHPAIAGFHHSPERIAVDAAIAVGIPLLVGQYLLLRRQSAAAHQALAEETDRRRAESEVLARQLIRTTLARELHDMVAHHVTAIALHTGVVQHVLTEAAPEVRQVLADVHDTAAQALIDIRHLHSALQDPLLENVAVVEPGTLGAEITAAVERTRAAGYTVNTNVPLLPELDAVSRLTLLRVVQEALSNVMKHAKKSAPVSVSIAFRGNALQLDVTNATGTSEYVTTTRTTYGVAGIRERIDIVGGTLDIGQHDDQWLLSARIPFKASVSTDAGGAE